MVHITPTYFDESSIIGGGERYPSELAAWTARRTPTRLVSFSSRRQSARRGPLQIEIYPARHLLNGERGNPLSLRYLAQVLWADVVHIHSVYTMVSDLACLGAWAGGKKVFVTDHGGGGNRVLSQRLPVLPRYTGAVAISEFGRGVLPEILRRRCRLIKGGIDTERFCPDPTVDKQRHVLFVGRLLAHKGVNELIEAFRLFARPDYRLRILGRVHNEAFYADLQRLARGLPVDFIHDADDTRLLAEYRAASVTVLSSVHRTVYGDHSAMPELMGFTLLESQACGTPVICTDAGAMREFLDPGRTGMVAAQNSPASLCAALREVTAWTETGRPGVAEACAAFARAHNWETVVAQHLELYGEP